MEALAQNPESKSPVILYPQSGEGNVHLRQIRTLLEGEDSVRLSGTASAKEVAEIVNASGRALVIFSILNKEDLTAVLNALGEWSAHIKAKSLRVIGVCQINHQQIPALLMKRGCADLFSPSLNQKALRHKINQSLRIIETYFAQTGGSRAMGLSEPQAKSIAEVPLAEKQPQGGIQKLAALKIASDCWLVRKERDIRRVQGRWIVDIIGPGPSAGTWESIEKESGLWEWKPKASAESKEFVTEPGAWFYRGRRPEFVWDIGRWRFLGEVPELFFKNGDETLATRFKLVGHQMEVAENSSQAQGKLPAIIKSIENEVRFKNEAKRPGPAKEVKDSKKPSSEPAPEAIASIEDIASRILNYEQNDAPAEVVDPKVHDLTPVVAEISEGYAYKGELEPTPFNDAPKPKLKITVQPAQSGAGKPVKAEPIDLADEELVLEIQHGVFEAEQKVVVMMDDGLMTPSSNQRIDATVTEISTDDASDTITFKIDPGLKISFGPIREAIRERQEEILNFLKAARGW